MCCRSNCSYLQLQPSSKPALFPPRCLHMRELRVWKRRRLKIARRNFAIGHRSVPLLSMSFENLFGDLVKHFPSPNSLHLLAPALGFASGVALYLSRLNNPTKRWNSDVGEWILVTSPTPFNRFVLLRCPSICFDEAEFLEGVNEKLLKEERHFVNLNVGKIPTEAAGMEGSRFEHELTYQRICIGTEDGGVISLDWPANLDLTKEHGLDTTLLLVPGTPQGSMDRNVKSFVSDVVKFGYFPVIMNPRGCSGSPLTTARLFTAADSDDIFTAVQFINKSRPWSTMMAVGWGYGANMLTKYLGEVVERTPLTAAACIDNPFDLEEATRSFPHHVALDQKLKAGLVDILQANKELFQGRTKRFDVMQGLSATSVREFERAISMVSYGYDAIEEFYSKSSTRHLVGKLKIPVLFIQSDDGTVPLFSVPRASIAENPFTSLLLCSCLPSNAIVNGNLAILWCQQFVIEWLSAVELSLLKGRHPLLKDVDITINPSKGPSFLEDHVSDKRISIRDDISTNCDFRQSYLSYNNKFSAELVDHTKSSYLDEQPVIDSIHIDNHHNVSSQLETSPQKNSMNIDLANVEDENVLEIERSQVIQTAEVVMNMLDATVPGALADDQKKKVLTAVGQGETLIKALEGAVPEDVRGKLTAAVSDIVQTQGANLNLDGLKGIRVPSLSAEVKLKIQENLAGNKKSLDYKSKGIDGNSAGALNSNSQEIEREGSHSDELHNEIVNHQHDTESCGGRELQQSPKVKKIVDFDNSQVESSYEREILSSGSKDSSGGGQRHERSESFQENTTQPYNLVENELEVGKTDPSDNNEKGNGNDEHAMQDKINSTTSDLGKHIEQTMENDANDIQKEEEKQLEPTNDQDMLSSNSEGELTSSTLHSSEYPEVNKKESENDNSGDKQIITQGFSGKSEEMSPQSPSSSSSPIPPPMSVSQALDALTGFDDSTQMAVNSVFGVIENMIDQLEKESSHDNNEKIKDEDEESDTEPGKSTVSSDVEIEKEKHFKSGLVIQPNVGRFQGHAANNDIEKSAGSQWNSRAELNEKKIPVDHNPTYDDSIAESQGHNIDLRQSNMQEKISRQDMMNSSFSAEKSPELRLVDNLPVHIIAKSYASIPYSYVSKYAPSKTLKEKSLDLDSTTDLFLEYFPEEGQWRLLDQLGLTKDSMLNTETYNDDNVKGHNINSPLQENDGERIIEPSYIILDDEHGSESNELDIIDEISEKNRKPEFLTVREEDVMSSIETVILDTLKVEVGRRIGASNLSSMESLCLTCDLEQVAAAVTLSIRQNNVSDVLLETEDTTSVKFSKLQAEYLVEVITSAVHSTTHLRKILPVGVIVGPILASLRKYLNVITLDNCMNEKFSENEDGKLIHNLIGHEDETNRSRSGSVGKPNTSASVNTPGNLFDVDRKSMKNETIMVGAFTAALGASALLAHHKDKEPLKENNSTATTQESHQNNIVTSLTEKALSVAAPVVPTKGDGEVDEERLVAMLADLGQKGGMLKLIGKIALLWGGIRGAMSLTDRLISFLQIGERPLLQRILGFGCMVLVLWSPVVVPFLPTLVQNWMAHKSMGIAEYACIAGLYTSVMILVTLWGKRTRGYENPLQKYGLDMTCSSTPYDFLKGWIGGVALVMSIHSVNVALGFACFLWPSGGPLSSEGILSWVKACGRLLLLALRGIVPATCLVVVEEVLFRSWLPVEIAVDLGYKRAIIISSFTFALVQRSFLAIPGLLLLSLALSGAKERDQGKLSVPIGLRSGAMTTTFILHACGFILYRPDAPHWATGTHSWQPFGGVIGMAFCALLAVLFLRPGLSRENHL